MKKIAGIITGIALLAPLPTLANELETVITGGFALGERSVDSADFNESNTKPYELSVKASIPLAQNISTQLNVFYEKFDGINDDSEDSQFNTASNVHASYRNPEKFLVGIFGGHSRSALNGDHSYNMDWVGIEGQLYCDDLTVYAQAAYGDRDDGNPFSSVGCNDCVMGRLEVRYFLDEDFMVRLNPEYGRVNNYSADGDGDFSSFELSAEKRLLADIPLYGKASYRSSGYDDSDKTVEEETFMIGVNYYCGTKNLKHNDRYGATLDTPMSMTRANSWTEELF